MREVEQAQPDVDERLVANRSERAEPSQAHAPEKEQGSPKTRRKKLDGSRRKELVVIGGQKRCRSGQVLDSGELEGATRCFEWLHMPRWMSQFRGSVFPVLLDSKDDEPAAELRPLKEKQGIFRAVS